MRDRGRGRTVTAVGGPVRHPRGLAPPHVGGTLGAVLLGQAILGVAMLILAIGVIAGGLTLGSRFSDPPPNVAEVGRPLVLAGGVLLVLAAAELALVVAIVVADWRPARRLAAALNALLAIVAAGASLRALRSGADPDVVVSLGLGAAAAFFVLATMVLVIQERRRAAEAAAETAAELPAQPA